MGMYDEIECDLPLPDGFRSTRFQTKSLDCTLTLYRITNAGTFERATYTDNDSWFGDQTGWEPDPFFGTIRFYDFDANDQWHEYAVHVSDGQVVGDIRKIQDLT